MTIREAIDHCREVAAECKATNCKEPEYDDSKCNLCMSEHLQLAEWLEELVELRKLVEEI